MPSTLAEFGEAPKMNNPYQIRRILNSEMDRILEIERASFGKDAYDRRLFAEYVSHCGDLFLVAVRAGKIRGYMLTCVQGKRAELVSVAVDPGARGRGAASSLMKSTIRRLKLRGADRLMLTVKVTNQPAMRFYDRFEFRRLRRLPGYYEDGKDGWRMGRPL